MAEPRSHRHPSLCSRSVFRQEGKVSFLPCSLLVASYLLACGTQCIPSYRYCSRNLCPFFLLQDIHFLPLLLSPSAHRMDMADLRSTTRSEEDSTMFQSARRWEPKCTTRIRSLSCLPWWGVCWTRARDGGIAWALLLNDFVTFLTFLCLSYPSLSTLLCLWMWGSRLSPLGAAWCPTAFDGLWRFVLKESKLSWPGCISLLAGLSLSYKQYSNFSIHSPDFTPQPFQILSLP